MSGIAKSVVSLRILGDELDPVEMTRLLGCESSSFLRKGDIRSSRAGKETRYKTSVWMIEAEAAVTDSVDVQVKSILDRLTFDLAIWKSITQRYQVDLFCGLFMDELNEGLDLEPHTMLALGERGIKLGLDIYGPMDETADRLSLH